MSETFVPTVQLSYMNVDGKLLLHQLWVSADGVTDWRRVPIRSNRLSDKIENPLYREIMQHKETQVFGGDEWDDRGMLVRRDV